MAYELTMTNDPEYMEPTEGEAKGMTNFALKQIIERYGDRIAVLHWDNGQRVYFGYGPDNPRSACDAIFQTVAGVDFVGWRRKSGYSRDAKLGVTSIQWHMTCMLQTMSIMDEGFEDYRPDPNGFF